jgi:cytochrome b6-f complex iron-sulfur subunit
MNRRDFVRASIAGGIGLAVVATGGVFFFANRSGGGRIKGDITVPKANIPEAGGAPFSSDDGHFHLINNEDGALALYWQCTHQGCKVPWKDGEDQFHCPCHGSIFDRHGVVTGGPAPQPLTLFTARVTETGDVIVDTRTPVARTEYEPGQAVKV